MEEKRTFTAFAGTSRIASGSVEAMLRRTKEYLDRDGAERVLIFEDRTGAQVDFDFSGSVDDVLARVPGHPLFVRAVDAAERSGPGRPKLGVVSREVSLLPRHWEWLERQPKGISATLRRLVDEARKLCPDEERAREARDAASRFMWVMAGNLPGFEEATRALFADDRPRLTKLMREWPADIRKHVLRLIEAMERPEGAERGEGSSA
jgi:uncharacterized protein